VFTPFHKPPYPYLYGRSVDETTTAGEDGEAPLSATSDKDQWEMALFVLQTCKCWVLLLQRLIRVAMYYFFFVFLIFLKCYDATIICIFFCYKCFVVLHYRYFFFATIALWLVSLEEPHRNFLCYDATIEQIVCYIHG
jgi:hypothetical protein